MPVPGAPPGRAAPPVIELYRSRSSLHSCIASNSSEDQPVSEPTEHSFPQQTSYRSCSLLIYLLKIEDHRLFCRSSC
eukprot:1661028-Prymnesium_polylepis.1